MEPQEVVLKESFSLIRQKSETVVFVGYQNVGYVNVGGQRRVTPDISLEVLLIASTLTAFHCDEPVPGSSIMHAHVSVHTTLKRLSVLVPKQSAVKQCWLQFAHE